MKIIVTSFAAVFSLACATQSISAPAASECHCRHVSRKEVTRSGGNEMVIFIEEKNYREIRGVVHMIDERLAENTLVEVFDHPEYLLNPSVAGANSRPRQNRLAACITSADGKFCFRHLASGKYEIRSSSGAGINVTHVYVTVDNKSGETKDISVQMILGT